MKPGIYYNLPEDEYHEVDAVSSSRLQDMIISPLECWAKHVDPDREPDEPTEAQARGRGYHARLLEGLTEFEDRFARLPDIKDYPHVLKGGDALKKALEERKLPKSGTIAEMSRRLSEEGQVPKGNLWHFIIEDFNAAAGNRKPLKAIDYDRICRAGDVIEATGFDKVFEGGRSEVSIFWESVNGFLCKARIDKLKRSAAIDLKTFANTQNKPLDVAVAHAFIFGRHHIQAYWYREAWKEAVSAGWLEPPEDDLFRWWNVYYQTGAAPNIEIREFKQKNAGQTNNYWLTAKNETEWAFGQYCRWMKERGTEPWISSHAPKGWSDTDFPSYAIDK